MAAPAGAPPAAPPPGAPPAAGLRGTPPPVPTTASLTGTIQPNQSITLPDGSQVTGDLKQNADGSFTVSSGAYAGLQLNAQRQPDPGSLQQVQAVQKAQSQPGGLPPGSYSVNPDGTLTITDTRFAPAGTIINKQGAYVNPDGTPYPQGGVPGNPPQFAVRQPDGAPATANPNFKGQSDTLSKAAGIVEDVAVDNPIGGQIKAGYDLATGKPKNQVTNDLANAISGGTVGVDSNGNLTPGSLATDAGKVAGGLGINLPDLGGGTSGINTSGAQSQIDRANKLADALGVQANAAGAQADTDRGLGNQTREQQEQSIQQLQDAASGETASPAELQLKQQASVDAARQYGLAAALQGNNPAAALRQASLGAANVAGTTNQNAAILRANETANARTALANALGNVRQSDQGAVNTDVTQQNALNNAQTTETGQATTGQGQILSAQAAKAQADAQKTGAELGAIGALGTGILTKSDARSKKNVRTANLADALGKNVHGVVFEYKPSEEESAHGPQFGVLAQELERVLPSVVRPDAAGMKRVATAPLTMANTATLAELARRIDDLERKGGKKKAA